MNKQIIIIGILVLGIIGILTFYNLKINALEAEITILTIDNKKLNETLKNNDEIATNVIEELNTSLRECQLKQNELVDFCDKRVQLALKSVEVPVEEIIKTTEERILGIDKLSSDKYINEINLMINSLGKKKKEKGTTK